MIESLRMGNFKCFLDEELTLGKVTLLTGLNGGGKSSVIQALLALRQSHMRGMLTPAQTRLALNGEAIRLGAGRDVFNMFGDVPEVIKLELACTQASARLTFDYAAMDDILLGRAEIEGDIWSCPPFASHTRTSLRDPAVEYVSADRIGPRAAFGLADYDVGSHGVGARGEFAVHFLSALGTETIPISALARSPDSQTKPNLQLIHQVEAWLDIVSPGVRLAARADRSLDIAQLTYTFAAGTYGETNPFRPTNVGFGLTYSLPLLTALLGAAPGSLLMFENPEAHLHPRGHFEFAMLMALAAKHGVQIIVESHSDHVLNGLRVAVREGVLEPDDLCLQFFDRGADLPVSHARRLAVDCAGGVEEWPPSFFDEWDNALLRLLGD